MVRIVVATFLGLELNQKSFEIKPPSVEMSWSINYFLSCFSKSLVEGAESPLTRESPAGSLNKKNFVYNSRSEAALGTIHILRNPF